MFWKVEMLRWLVLLWLFAASVVSHADVPVWTSLDANGQTEVNVYLFWSLNCPHCLAARPQIIALAAERPWLHLHDLELTQHPAHVARFVSFAEMTGGEAQAVPTLIYCGRMDVGWEDDQEATNAFLARLADCRAGADTDIPLDQTVHHLRVPLLGELNPSNWSMPLLTVVIAGLDAFNPCAFFVLLFLLSLLVHQQSRRRMLLIGAVFVVFSGVMYFAFMAAWLNLFLLIGSLPWVTTIAGLLALGIAAVNIKDYLIFHQGVTLSISEGRKADIFQRARRILHAGSFPAMMATTVVLAVAANLYELLCTAGFPMVFTRLLTLHVVSPAQHYLYLTLYNMIYVLPLMAIVLAFVRSMGSRKLSEREGRLLKLLSGLMMLGLGVLLLIAPERLGQVSLALAVPALAIGLTWIAARWTPP